MYCTYLYLYGCDNVGGELSALAGLTQLAYLSLGSTSVSGELSGVAGLAQLTYLGLYSTSVSGELSALAGLAQLTYLNLYRCWGVSGSLDSLAGLIDLTYINMQGNSLVSGNVSSLAGMVGLTSFDLGSVDLVGDIAELAVLSELRGISCYMCSGLYGDVAALSATELTRIQVYRTSVGGDVLHGGELKRCAALANPCRQAFADWGVAGIGRMSWDPIAVLLAVRGPAAARRR